MDGLFYSLGIEKGDDWCKEYLRYILKWLKENSNEESGIWGEKSASLLQKVNGCFKIIVFFCFNLSWLLPKPKRVIDTCLKHLDNKEIFGPLKGHGCHDLDVFVCLWQALSQTDYRSNEIQGKARERLKLLRFYLRSDGGFGDTPVSPESDEYKDGKTTHSGLLVLALPYCLDLAFPLLRRELGIHLPYWSGPQWSNKELKIHTGNTARGESYCWSPI